MQPLDPKAILEAVLLTAAHPLPLSRLRQVFEEKHDAATLKRWLDELQQKWQSCAVELVEVAGGWRFRSCAIYQPYIERLKEEKPPRYSRAVLETLAIIAYRQPVTRGDIEDIRGVSVSTAVIKTLESRGWIDVVGQRDTPGRPALLATTAGFLNDLGLRNLSELPELAEIERIMDFGDTKEIPATIASATEEKD